MSTRYGPSLAQLVDAQNRVMRVWLDASFVHPFTAEQLSTISYALGALSAARLAEGQRLADGERPGFEAHETRAAFIVRSNDCDYLVCWHCLDVLMPGAAPHCERCPPFGECDVEGCDAPGCKEENTAGVEGAPHDDAKVDR